MLKKQKKIQKNILLTEDLVQKLVDLAAEKNLTFGGVVEYLVGAPGMRMNYRV